MSRRLIGGWATDAPVVVVVQDEPVEQRAAWATVQVILALWSRGGLDVDMAAV